MSIASSLTSYMAADSNWRAQICSGIFYPTSHRTSNCWSKSLKNVRGETKKIIQPMNDKHLYLYSLTVHQDCIYWNVHNRDIHFKQKPIEFAGSYSIFLLSPKSWGFVNQDRDKVINMRRHLLTCHHLKILNIFTQGDYNLHCIVPDCIESDCIISQLILLEHILLYYISCSNILWYRILSYSIVLWYIGSFCIIFDHIILYVSHCIRQCDI